MIYNLIEMTDVTIGKKTMLHCPKCGTKLNKYHIYEPEADGESYYPYTGLICNKCGLKSKTHYNDQFVPGGGYKLSKAACKYLLAEMTKEVSKNA
jgi:RNase P subunit RPR2